MDRFVLTHEDKQAIARVLEMAIKRIVKEKKEEAARKLAQSLPDK